MRAIQIRKQKLKEKIDEKKQWTIRRRMRLQGERAMDSGHLQLRRAVHANILNGESQTRPSQEIENRLLDDIAKREEMRLNIQRKREEAIRRRNFAQFKMSTDILSPGGFQPPLTSTPVSTNNQEGGGEDPMEEDQEADQESMEILDAVEDEGGLLDESMSDNIMYVIKNTNYNIFKKERSF